MKNLHYSVVVVCVLFLLGFVLISFMQGTTNAKSEGANNTPTTTSEGSITSIENIPDMEYVPFYTNPTITFTNTEVTKLSHVTYKVDGSIDQVDVFYKEMLPRRGWTLRSGESQRNLYSWSDPEDKVQFKLFLTYSLELSQDHSGTLVYLKFGRVPNITGQLPAYPGSRQVSITHSSVQKNFNGELVHVGLTDVTYASSANLQEIAAYYIDALREAGWSYQELGWSTGQYSWFPFDELGSWEGFSTQEGLYFVMWHPAWGEDPTVIRTYHLLATAELQYDGSSIVKIHVEEWDESLSF